MKSYKIKLYVEREYEKSKWCKETLSGLETTASKHKVFLELNYDEANTIYETFMPNEIIMILGTTESWFINLLSKLNSCECRILLISNAPLDLNGNVSRVIFNREESMQSAMKYIAMTGRKACALFGFNPNSPSDTLRYKTFFDNCKRFGIDVSNKDDIYLNNGSVEDCCKQLLNRLDSYNSVICANDPVAVYLMRKATENGVRIPDDLYILGFGDSILSGMVTPSLSTISLDYHEIGNQAMGAYLYLLKHPEISSMDIFIPCKIVPRQSTNFEEYIIVNEIIYYPCTNNDLFFNDPDISEFFILEHFFEQCDEIDLEIIKGLMQKIRYESLAEKLHISEYTLKYRLKKIYNTTKTNNRNSFDALIEKYNMKI